MSNAKMSSALQIHATYISDISGNTVKCLLLYNFDAIGNTKNCAIHLSRFFVLGKNNNKKITVLRVRKWCSLD